MRRIGFFAVLMAILGSGALRGAESETAAKPLKVLYITGGGYHDYKKLTPLLTDGMKKHANVQFDIKWELETLRDKQLGDGYDAIVYNLCFGEDNDPQMIENALRVTRDGKPTMFVHCSMHTFQASDAWTECCGQRTRQHDAYRGFGVEKVNAEHPAIKQFPDDWKTAGDELYQTIDLPKTSTPLLRTSKPDEKGNRSTVCWVHQYGKGPVFATTLGHDMKTCKQASYQSLLAHGLLWACDKLDADGKPKAGFGPAN